MEGSAKREGCNLETLEREVREVSEVREQEPIAGLTTHLCIWGIERFFDPKSCYKYFCKNFGEHADLTHLLKQKSKSFFVVRFSSPLSAEQFNSQYAKNKRIKAKALQEGMQLP
jgi:hypothetical protein